MSRLRFNVGDLARLVIVREASSTPFVGCIVEVLRVGPLPPGAVVIGQSGIFMTAELADYWVVGTNARLEGTCMDWQLAPIDPPAEPASLTRRTHLEEPATA